MADWTGKTLGRVQINDLIARGGMAEIYTGIPETHGLVAVKVMRGLLEREEHQLTRFKREIQRTPRLSGDGSSLAKGEARSPTE